MAHAPNLTCVQLRRLVAASPLGKKASPQTALLAAHKVAWPTYGPLASSLDQAWRSAEIVEVRAACEEQPPCPRASEATGVATCIVEARLHGSIEADDRVPPCLEKPMQRTCPAFRDGSAPETSAPCALCMLAGERGSCNAAA